MSGIDHKYWARKILYHLVSRIMNYEGGEKYVTYLDFAQKIGYPEPHTYPRFQTNIGITLGKMGYLFQDMVIDGEEVPMIQALIVNKNTQLPGSGFKEFYPQYPKLSNDKKRDLVLSEYKKVFDFGTRWEKVLLNLGIEIPEPITQTEDSIQEKFGLHNPYGSEGSPEHKALRDFIANNPGVIGIYKTLKSFTEYPLKSGDIVDVYFESVSDLTGVEIKSRRSGPDDIERGLYQCIKYQSVLEAELKVKKQNKNVTVILVLEEELPRKLKSVRTALGIEVKEHIKPIIKLHPSEINQHPVPA